MKKTLSKLIVSMMALIVAATLAVVSTYAWLTISGAPEVDGIQVPFFLEGWRFRSDSVALLKFQDIDSSEDANEYVGADVYFPHSLTPEPDEDDEYTWRHFTGWQVVDAQAGPIGIIDYVEDSTVNTIFCVDGKLVPANEDFIERIDAKERIVYMTLPEGLLDL